MDGRFGVSDRAIDMLQSDFPIGGLDPPAPQSGGEMAFRNRALVVVAFAIAMAYLEAAVVVYLQRALGITPAQLFPLQSGDVVGNLAPIEVGREFATLVMLAGIGWLAGRRWIDRLAWTSVAFGVWDIFYYAWLWVFIGWPSSPGTWDVLFLIPLPWAGPVWAPVSVSGALVGFGLAAARQTELGRVPRVTARAGLLAVAGGIVVVISFLGQAPALLDERLPGWFPWPIFLAGMAMAAGAAVVSLKAGAAGGERGTG
jgi:hypothetical protein